MEYFGLIFLVLVTRFHVFSQTCICDLTSNQCDLNCCCDPICTAEDKLSFSRCDPIEPNRVDKVCVSDSILYSSNGKYQAEGNGAGLFCIFKDNYEARHFYSTIPSVSTQSAFEELAKKYRTSSYGATTTVQQSYEKSFKAGDPLFVLFEDNEQGYLTLPIQFTNGLCQDSNEARFLFKNQTSCSRIITNAESQCKSEKSWNALTYATGYKVAPYPSFILGTTRFIEVTNSSIASANASVELVTVNDPRLIQPVVSQPLRCKDIAGVITDCPFSKLPSPTYNATTKVCNNVVLGISYHINYTASNVTVEISELDLSFVIGSVPDGSVSFQQTFATTFEETVFGNVTNTTVIDRSGNPGYLIGLPVMSGNSFTIAAGTFIAVNQQPVTYFSTILSTAQGTCNVASQRSPIAYGSDYRSGCFMSVKNVMTLAECQQLQTDIFNLLLKDIPTHIGSFGNSNGEVIEDWVVVINEKPKTQPAVSNGQCGKMITGVVFEFITSRTGYFSNPQNKIIGFQIKYEDPRSLLLQCNGLICSTTQKVEIHQSVSFVDASLVPQAEVKPKPKFESKAPNDFFYPFL